MTPNPDGPSGAGESERARPSQETARQGSRRDPRDERFERRDRHQTAALGEAFRACGNRLTGKAATLMAAAGEAAITGVCRCNNVHLCPWCGSRILAVRAANVQAMADGLAERGYGLHLGTNTLRHFARMPFGSNRKGRRHGLISVLHDGWAGAYGSAGRRWRRMRDDFGIVGYERSYEDTFGFDTGWHLHWHTLWVTLRPLTTEEQAAFRRALAQAWADAVRAAGGYEVSMTCDRPGCSCGGEGHGTDLRPINGDDPSDAARYLYKDGDKGTAAIGLELSRQDFKSGRRGRLGPWQLGDAAAAELAERGEPGPFTERYRERERGIFGVRKQYRTQNLNRLVRELGIPQDERTEDEITDESGGLQPIAVIPSGTWYRHIARVPGRRLDLVKCAERGGLPAVRHLVEAWGLRWGIDVFDPPTEDDQEHGATPAGVDGPKPSPLLEVPAARTFVEHIHRTRRRVRHDADDA
ncbi:hypothetical protein [Streptomyces albus]|uniref:hypothetical protein n=1 Tax=Streptomyces albus TaxID=1888 RepID=UPI003F1A905E